MNNAVELITTALPPMLGSQLEAIYQFNPNATTLDDAGNGRLLAIVTPDFDIHALHQQFYPFWQKHQETLPYELIPFFATRQTLQRYGQFHPVFAHHLKSSGRLCYGTTDLHPVLPAINNHDYVAYLAAACAELSVTLAPDLLEPDEAVRKETQLRQLIQQIRQKESSPEEKATDLIAYLQHTIQRKISQDSTIPRWQAPHRPTTSLLLPSLYATYLYLGQMVMVYEHLTPHQVVNTDWQNVSDRLGSHVKGLRVTTATQLHLILTHENPLAFTLRNYNHDWGFHLLEELEVEAWRVMRNAARTPAAIQIEQLPAAYLTTEDTAVGKLIHDFQNKLLNIQLEHELLRRILGIPGFTPPEPLPGRGHTDRERVNANFQHLDWWAGFYLDQMLTRRDDAANQPT